LYPRAFSNFVHHVHVTTSNSGLSDGVLERIAPNPSPSEAIETDWNGRPASHRNQREASTVSLSQHPAHVKREKLLIEKKKSIPDFQQITFLSSC
jgi:hypothetical protein